MASLPKRPVTIHENYQAAKNYEERWLRALNEFHSIKFNIESSDNVRFDHAMDSLETCIKRAASGYLAFLEGKAQKDFELGFASDKAGAL